MRRQSAIPNGAPSDLAELVSSTPVGSWTSNPESIRHVVGTSFSREIKRRWADGIVRAIEARDVVGASHSLGVGLIALPDEAFVAARRHGIFRISRYGFDETAVGAVVGALMAAPAREALPARVHEYLATVKRLHAVGLRVRWLRQDLAQELGKRGAGVFDGLARSVELKFFDRLLHPMAVLYNRPEHSVEEFAQALSELWVIGAEEGIHARLGEHLPDLRGIHDGSYDDMLKRAMPIRAFLEWERLVDAFDFDFVEEGRGKRYRIRAKTPELEKAIRFGFIHTELQQRTTLVAAAGSTQALSLEAAVAFLDERLAAAGIRLARWKRKPVSRYQIEKSRWLQCCSRCCGRRSSLMKNMPRS